MAFISGEEFSVYIKRGDSYLKSFKKLLVEIIGEFSRSLALTVRSTVRIMVGHVVRVILCIGFKIFLEAGCV